MVSTSSKLSYDPLPVQLRTLTGAGGLPLAATAFPTASPLQASNTLLFAHGFGQTRGAWQRSGMALAAEGYAGLSYDARGAGPRYGLGLPGGTMQPDNPGAAAKPG